jgi:hypothetical protein
MAVARAEVPTAHASRHLRRLCKHWGHKYPVRFTPGHGRIEMSAGVLVLEAGPEALDLHLTAAPEDLPRMRGVVAEHLRRFAFKETLAFDWTAWA